MLRNSSLSTTSRLNVGLLQLTELYNAWSVGRDHCVQLILRFVGITLLTCRWSGRWSPPRGSSLWRLKHPQSGSSLWRLKPLNSWAVLTRLRIQRGGSGSMWPQGGTWGFLLRLILSLLAYWVCWQNSGWPLLESVGQVSGSRQWLNTDHYTFLLVHPKPPPVKKSASTTGPMFIKLQRNQRKTRLMLLAKIRTETNTFW